MANKSEYPDSIKMCFYDQYQMRCNHWKWGHFKQHCSKEYRTGETCGMKLPLHTYQKAENCKTCDKIETKRGRQEKEHKRINRWYQEMQSGISRGASIEASEAIIEQLEHDIAKLESDLRYSERCL